MHRTIQHGTIEDREGRGRKKTARTPENVDQAREKPKEGILNSSCYFVLFVSCFEKNSLFRSGPLILLHPVNEKFSRPYHFYA